MLTAPLLHAHRDRPFSKAVSFGLISFLSSFSPGSAIILKTNLTRLLGVLLLDLFSIFDIIQ
jgi:hypothetical protein